MINFKHHVNYKNDDFISIFAPNAAGKTLFAESHSSIGDTSYFIVNRSAIKNVIARRTTENTSVQNNESFLFDLGIKLRLTEKGLKKVNSFLTRFQISVSKGSENFNDIELKRGRSLIRLNQTDEDKIKRKLKISSSEYEFVMFCLFYFSTYGENTLFIFDDPVEMASFENEWWFKEVISDNFKRVMILTHRFYLFKRFPGLHKKISKSSHFYFLDDIPYKINSKSSTFFETELFPKIILKNKMYERDVRESVKSGLARIPNDSSPAVVYFKQLNQNKIDSIGLLKPYSSTYVSDLFSEVLSKALSSKRDLFNNIRQEVIRKYNKKEHKKIKLLSRVKVSSLKKSASVDMEIEFIFRALNASNHQTEWKMFNEINTPKFLEMMRRNINMSGNLGTIIKLAMDKHEVQYKKLSSVYMKYIEEDIFPILNGRSFKRKNRIGVTSFDSEQGILFSHEDNGGGPVGLDELSEILKSLEGLGI